MYESYSYQNYKCDGCGKSDEYDDLELQINEGKLDFCNAECKKLYEAKKKKHADEMAGIRNSAGCTLKKIPIDPYTPHNIPVDIDKTYLICYDGSWETGHFCFEHFPQFFNGFMHHQLNYGGDKDKIHGKWQAIYEIIRN